MSTTNPQCSFCGAHENEVLVLVAAPQSGVFICDECVVKSLKIIKSQTDPSVP